MVTSKKGLIKGQAYKKYIDMHVALPEIKPVKRRHLWNAPAWQPCPICKAGCKRDGKIETKKWRRARYLCRKCGGYTFYVECR